LRRVIDSHLCARNPRVYMLDPDVLFFSHPGEMLEEAPCGLFAKMNAEKHGDLAKVASVIDSRVLYERFGLRYPLWNCGLGWYRHDMLDWTFIDKVFGACPLLDENRFFADLTILAMHYARLGFAVLPQDRYVVDHKPDYRRVAACHYFAKSRYWFYREGIPTLLELGLLRRT
jgi:hypothetical protein